MKQKMIEKLYEMQQNGYDIFFVLTEFIQEMDDKHLQELDDYVEERYKDMLDEEFTDEADMRWL